MKVIITRRTRVRGELVEANLKKPRDLPETDAWSLISAQKAVKYIEKKPIKVGASKAEVADWLTDNETTLKQLKADHAGELKQLADDHAGELEQLADDRAGELGQLADDHETEVALLQQQLADAKKANSGS
jgi:hypothetical protein